MSLIIGSSPQVWVEIENTWKKNESAFRKDTPCVPNHHRFNTWLSKDPHRKVTAQTVLRPLVHAGGVFCEAHLELTHGKSDLYNLTGVPPNKNVYIQEGYRAG